MNIEKFKEIIKKRIHIEDISHGEWEEGIEECRKEEVDILTNDIDETILYLKNDCTPEEYVWISEIIDEVIEKTGSKDFLHCYKKMMSKFPKECEMYNIIGSIEYAENIICERVEDGEE